MPKQIERVSLVEGTFFLLLACSIFIVAYTPSLTAQTTLQTKVGQAAAVTDALKTSFGSALEVVKEFKPFYLAGDFNGDGAQDVVIVVRIMGRRSGLPPDVKVLNPFHRTDKPAFPADPAAKPTLAFAVIHGTKAGWKTSQPAGKFLLVGESPILILENDRASGRPEDAKGLMEIISKRGKRRGATSPPAAAKGDSILLGTEATESILYWNGRTYRWEEFSDEGE